FPELLEVLQREAGKSATDAFIEASGIFPVSTYFLVRGPRVLKDRRIDRWATLVIRARMHYAPRGVVAIVAPWNYPFLIPAYESFAAWVAGNAVIVKPSEWTPLVMQKCKEIWDTTGLPKDLFRLVQGFGDT